MRASRLHALIRRAAPGGVPARLGTLLLAILAVEFGVTGCQRPAPPTAAADSFSAVPVPDTASYSPEADAPGLDREFGIGFLYFAGGEPPLDERLPIRAAPDVAAGVVAEFRLLMPDGTGWQYFVADAADAVETPNLVEYGYEESGLPFDSLSADGEWARVVYGSAADGGVLRGWARLEGVEHALWRDWLPTRAAFFLHPERARLHQQPGGPRLEFPLATTGASSPYRYDYHLEPDSAAGDWLRVRVVTPSDACVVESPDVRDTVAWTRFIDERGRPLVWYYSRGC